MYKEHILLTNGFSKADFEIMEDEEFDFHFNMIMEKNQIKRENNITGGLI